MDEGDSIRLALLRWPFNQSAELGKIIRRSLYLAERDNFAKLGTRCPLLPGLCRVRASPSVVAGGRQAS